MFQNNTYTNVILENIINSNCYTPRVYIINISSSDKKVIVSLVRFHNNNEYLYLFC